jgi:hypothetical protein
MNNEPEDFSKKRLDECVATARTIHSLIGERVSDMPILKGKNAKETTEQLKWYQDFIQSKIFPAISTADLRTGDVEFLSGIILQPVDFVREALQEIITDEIREKILLEIAKSVISFMSVHTKSMPMGDISKEQHENLKNVVKSQMHEQLEPIISKLIDIQAVMDLVIAPYKLINNVITSTRDVVVDAAVAYKFDLKKPEDLRFSHIVKSQLEKAEKDKANSNP